MNKDATPALINENVKKYGAVVINSSSTVEDEASGVTYGAKHRIQLIAAKHGALPAGMSIFSLLSSR